MDINLEFVSLSGKKFIERKDCEEYDEYILKYRDVTEWEDFISLTKEFIEKYYSGYMGLINNLDSCSPRTFPKFLFKESEAYFIYKKTVEFIMKEL
jgi:hypothetical protein